MDKNKEDAEEVPQNTVNIEGIPKAIVLLALYNNALSNGKVFEGRTEIEKIKSFHEGGSLMEAEALIQRGQRYFDYVDLGSGDQPLKVTLRETEFWPDDYNRYHGEGLAERTISALRSEMIFLLHQATATGTFEKTDNKLAGELLWMKKAKKEKSSYLTLKHRQRDHNSNSAVKPVKNDKTDRNQIGFHFISEDRA